MTLDEIIRRIEDLNRPDRNLDRVIAHVLAWKQTSAKLSDEADGEEERVAWLGLKARSEGEVPYYTSSIQDAYLFARQMAPRSPGGIAWEYGTASAQIGEDEPVQASTPAIAVVLAALRNLVGRLRSKT